MNDTVTKTGRKEETMAQFTIRVELHEVNRTRPTAEDYEDLHLAMQRRSYFRVIKSDSGNWYHLPPAEYTVTWDATKSVVCSEVKEIACSVWSKAAILVTESNGRQWNGLIPASISEVNALMNTNV